jgi:inner membrane protein
MPSPVGHALGGVAAGWLLEPEHTASAPGRSRIRLETLGFAALGIAADLDLLVGSHRGATHSVGAVMVVGLVAWLALRRRSRRARWAIACGGAFGSHVLLDWLGSDTSAPFGLSALWPFSSAYYQAPWSLFPAVSRRIHQPDLFWIPNVLAVGRELVILVPVVVLVGAMTSRTRKNLRTGAIAATLMILGWVGAVEHLSGSQTDLAMGVEETTQDRAKTFDDSSSQTKRTGPYAEAVEKYLRGEFKEALIALGAMPQTEVRNQERDLKKEPRLLQAAAMLHTEAAQTEILDDPIAQFHLSRARHLVTELRTIQPSGDFQRGWYLLASAILQGSKSVANADDLLEEARRLFPQDAELLVSTGAAFELHGAVSYGTGADRRMSSTVREIEPDAEIRRAFQSAARYLNEAATLAPELDEAHLRLGRVLHRLGQIDRAAGELDAVRRHAQDGSFKYLAAIFDAALESTKGRPQRAAELYKEALEILPAQSAFVGLSHSYYELGRGDDAAQALESVFRLPAKQPDPWFAYLASDAWHTDSRLKAMRALVTQPTPGQQ